MPYIKDKNVTRRDNGDEAVEQIRNYVATKQRLAHKAEAANNGTRERDAVYVDKLLNEVWVNVVMDGETAVDVILALRKASFDFVNHVNGEYIYKFEA